LSLQLALDALRAMVPVLYIGLEIAASELLARLLSLITKIPWGEIHRGNLNAKQVQHCKAAFRELVQLELFFEQGAPNTYSYNHARSSVFWLRNHYPTGHLMMIVDYLQLLSPASREDVRDRIRNAAYTLKTASRETNMVMICLSSTARSNYEALNDDGKMLGNGDPVRLIGTGKESGDIEFGADNVLVLARQLPDPMEGISRVWAAVAKVRAGSRSWVPLHFIDGSRFEFDEPWFPEIEAPEKPVRNGKIRIDPKDAERL
jgi:replicative DNA helicase